MKRKPITPYNRLLQSVRDFRWNVFNPKKKTMFYYPKNRLSTESWYLLDLYERVKAADQLDHDVKLVANDEGLFVQYVKRPADIDYSL